MPETFKWRMKWNHLPYRVVFEKGFEVEYEKGIKKALPFYKQAAEMGYAVAQYTLGTYYDEQAEFSSTKRDEEKYSCMAFGFYEQAAKQGYAPAQDALRDCYIYGIGCGMDKAKALYWCEKAAEQNYLPALKKLPDMYADGVGCRRDSEKARQWKQRYEAELAEHPEWDPKQDPHCRQAAMAQYEKTGRKPNSPDAVKCPPPPENAAEIKPEPRPAPKPAPKAEPTKLSCTGKPDDDDAGQTPLNCALEASEYYGNSQYEKAYPLMEKAAQSGDRVSMYLLAAMLVNGQGCTPDEKMAMYWLEQSAKKGFALAQLSCADCYRFGVGCEENYEKAFFWAGKAAQDNCLPDAHYLYGVMLAGGIGCAANQTEGIRWVKKAAEKGHEDAKKLLEKLGAAL